MNVNKVVFEPVKSVKVRQPVQQEAEIQYDRK
jgi:hypothetical protein